MSFKHKYLSYKKKYLDLKNQCGDGKCKKLTPAIVKSVRVFVI
jgi:hypothetical protein